MMILFSMEYQINKYHIICTYLYLFEDWYKSIGDRYNSIGDRFNSIKDRYNSLKDRLKWDELNLSLDELYLFTIELNQCSSLFLILVLINLKIGLIELRIDSI